ncbi:MAG: hypothetical protein V3W45_01910, partial [Sedimentisphaerales bacterium]
TIVIDSIIAGQSFSIVLMHIFCPHLRYLIELQAQLIPYGINLTCNTKGQKILIVKSVHNLTL